MLPVIYMIVFLTITPSLILVQGQSVTENRHGASVAEERDTMKFLPYRHRTPIEVLGEKMAERGREDLNNGALMLSEDMLINSMLAHLQRVRDEAEQIEACSDKDYEVPQTGDDESSEDKFSMDPEYTEYLPETWEREARHLLTEEPLCHFGVRHVLLNRTGMEYFPHYYEEIICGKTGHDQTSQNEICSKHGYSCVQKKKTIYFAKRHFAGKCWETEPRIIRSGCECMWPTKKLGEVKWPGPY